MIFKNLHFSIFFFQIKPIKFVSGNFWIGCEGDFIELEHHLINAGNPYLTECHRCLVDFSPRMMLQNKKPTEPSTLCLLGSVTRWATLLPSATKLRRLCFHRRVSVHRGGAWSWGPGPGGCLVPPSPGRYGYCCGRYASYWNAFLLRKEI